MSRLVLTWVASDVCILFTAADAHMREYDLRVPADAVAGKSAERTAQALEVMRETCAAEIRPTTDVSLDECIDAG